MASARDVPDQSAEIKGKDICVVSLVGAVMGMLGACLYVRGKVDSGL